MPSRWSCSPRSAQFLLESAPPFWSSRCCLVSRLVTATDGGRLVIHLYLRLVPDRANHLVAAGHDLVAFFETAEHFDIGGAGNPGFTSWNSAFPSETTKTP